MSSSVISLYFFFFLFSFTFATSPSSSCSASPSSSCSPSSSSSSSSLSSSSRSFSFVLLPADPALRMATLPPAVLACAEAALWGVFIGDALAMPVHWYYNLAQLKRDFPMGIQRYEAPPEKLPGSILNLSNTGGAGRGSDRGQIIGDVINHGKRKYWLKGGDYHYHATLKAGENTLEAQLSRVLMRSIAEQGGQFQQRAWLEAFETFMTTPGSHNDVYASSYIRMFFKNRVEGKPLEKCADNDHHNVDAIDALTLLPPVVLAAHLTGKDVQESVSGYLSSTRESRVLARYGGVYARMFLGVFQDAVANKSKEASALPPADSLRRHAGVAAQELGFNLERALAAYKDSDPMTACYIDSSFPALLVFVHKYAEDPVKALLASANAGGENVARGAVLGALMGAAYGMDAWQPAWCLDDLHDTHALRSEIASFLSSLV
eukprot:m.54875 g.54875  ORF g.54875 m.54875 type:complete len:434 (+) comp12906_c0_seq1:416-1717(+)